uniref:Uncharacterized protein n=1 Tax=Tetranychus urticae TaxID=32264 RepID=T1JR79_TETUR
MNYRRENFYVIIHGTMANVFVAFLSLLAEAFSRRLALVLCFLPRLKRDPGMRTM